MLTQEPHLFPAVLENISVPVVVFDASGHIALFNHACEAFTGYVFADIEGKAVWDVFAPPEQVEAFRTLYDRPQCRHFPRTHRLIWSLEGSRKQPVEWSERALLDKNSVLEYVVSTGTLLSADEQAVWEGLHGFRQFVETTPEIILVHDMTGKIIYLNKAGQALTGLDPVNWPEMSIADVFPLEERAAFMERGTKRQASDTGIYLYETRIRSRIGQLIPMEISSSLILENGEPSKVFVVARDVSERKRAENALRESEFRFRQIVENIEEVFWLVDFKWDVPVYLSPAYEKIYGYSRELPYTNPSFWQKVIHPEDVPRIIEEIKNRKKGEPRESEYRIIRADGTVRYLRDRAFDIYDENGETLMVAGISQDITERKLAEIALAQSEERFSKIFYASPVAIVLSTFLDGRVLDVNDSFLKLFGYSREEVIGRTSFELNLWVEPEERGRLMSLLQQAASVDDAEMQFRAKSGAIHDVLLSVELIELNSQTCVLGLLYDITERKKAEQQAIELAVEKARVKALTDFIKSASHDFRTPLATIRTGLYLLEKTSDPDRQRERIAAIDEQVSYIERIVNGIFMMARLDSNPNLSFAPVDVNSLVQQLDIKLRHTAASKGLALNLRLTEHLPTIQADIYEIYTALENLAENAIQYTSEGSVTLATRLHEGWVVVEVRDTGFGISEADLPHIMERFYRTDQARSISGRPGLGLSIVQRIVELHGGKVEVESAPGKGSTFRLLLPVGPEAES